MNFRICNLSFSSEIQLLLYLNHFQRCFQENQNLELLQNCYFLLLKLLLGETPIKLDEIFIQFQNCPEIMMNEQNAKRPKIIINHK